MHCDRTLLTKWSSVGHLLILVCLQPAQAVVANTVDWGCLDNPFLTSGGWKAHQSAGRSRVWWHLLLALQMAIFLLYPHLVERERSSLLHSSYKTLIPLMRVPPSSSHHLPKVPPLNTIIRSQGINTNEFLERHIVLIHSSIYFPGVVTMHTLSFRNQFLSTLGLRTLAEMDPIHYISVWVLVQYSL